MQNQNQEQEQQINVNLREAEDVKCSSCENIYFTPVVRIKRVSPLLSPSGEEMMAPIQTFQCSSCGNVNNQFLGELGP